MSGVYNMNVREISTTSSEVLDTLLSAIPFYKAVRKESEEQFAVLMQYSRIVQYDSGEAILSRGDIDTWGYFVVKGQLVVSLPDKKGQVHHINYITPGEVFGDIAVILKSPRTANVAVDSNCKEAVLFGTDFGVFNDLMDFTQVSLTTKLIYFRHINHSLRWKLDMYRSKYREHPMANQHRQVKPYTATKNDELELKGLYQQASDLAKLFVRWNEIIGSLSFADGGIPSPNLNI